MKTTGSGHSKDETLLISVAESIGSTLGTIAAKVTPVVTKATSASKNTRRRRATQPKRRASGRAAKKRPSAHMRARYTKGSRKRGGK